MRIALLLATLLLAGSCIASAANPSSHDSNQQPSASSSGDTLTGCLKGSKHQYYLVESDGSHHTVTSKSQNLGTYVNHMVTVTGKADTTRAANSDAEGHRSGYFVVDSVSDQGSCKK
jgi:hypothetical protein